MNRLAAIAILVAGATAATHAQSAPVAAQSNAAAPVALADYRSATIIAAETTRCGSKLCEDYIIASADTQYYVRATHKTSAPVLAAGATELFHVEGTSLRIAADANHKSRTLTVVSIEPLHPARPYLHGIG
jgi:hypothetical protein